MYVCMYVCMYACMHACMYVRMFTYTYLCIHIYLYMYACVYTCIHHVHTYDLAQFARMPRNGEGQGAAGAILGAAGTVPPRGFGVRGWGGMGGGRGIVSAVAIGA